MLLTTYAYQRPILADRPRRWTSVPGMGTGWRLCRRDTARRQDS